MSDQPPPLPPEPEQKPDATPSVPAPTAAHRFHAAVTKFKAWALSFAGRSKRAAQLVAKQSARTKLTRITLPSAYRALGKHAHGEGRFRADFADAYGRIDALLADIAKLTAAAPAVEGFKERAKAAGKAAKDKTHAQAVQLKLKHEYTELGRVAFEKHGEKSGPPDVVKPILDCRATLEQLAAEMRELSKSETGTLITPKRIAIGGLAVAALLLIAVVKIAFFGGKSEERQVAKVDAFQVEAGAVDDVKDAASAPDEPLASPDATEPQQRERRTLADAQARAQGLTDMPSKLRDKMALPDEIDATVRDLREQYEADARRPAAADRHSPAKHTKNNTSTEPRTETPLSIRLPPTQTTMQLVKTPVKTFDLGNERISHLKFSPKGKFLLVGSSLRSTANYRVIENCSAFDNIDLRNDRDAPLYAFSSDDSRLATPYHTIDLTTTPPSVQVPPYARDIAGRRANAPEPIEEHEPVIKGLWSNDETFLLHTEFNLGGSPTLESWGPAMLKKIDLPYVQNLPIPLAFSKIANLVACISCSENALHVYSFPSLTRSMSIRARQNLPLASHGGGTWSFARQGYGENMTFSPDGKMLAASVSYEQAEPPRDYLVATKVWSTESWQEQLTICADHYSVFSMFSPDNQYLVVAYGEVVELWDLSAKRQVFRRKFDDKKDYAAYQSLLSFSADGRLLARHPYRSASDGDRATHVDILKVQNGALFARVLDTDVCSCDFSPDGRTLVTGSLRGELKVWDITQGTSVTLADDGLEIKQKRDDSSRSNDDPAKSATFVERPGAAAAKEASDVPIVDLGEGKGLASVSHGNHVRRVQISADGRFVACEVSEDIHVFAVSNGSKVGTVRMDRILWNRWSITQDGQRVMVSFKSSGVSRMFDVVGGSAKSRLPISVKSDNLYATHADGQFYVGDDGRISLIGGERMVLDHDAEYRNGRSIADWDECAISSDGSVLAVGGKSLTVWSLRSGRIVQRMDGTRHGSRVLAFSEEGSSVFVAGGDEEKMVFEWKVTEGKLVRAYRVPKELTIECLAVNRKADLLACGISSSNSLACWCLSTGKWRADVGGAGPTVK